MFNNRARRRVVCDSYVMPVRGLDMIIVLGIPFDWFCASILRGTVKGVGFFFRTEFRGAWIPVSGLSIST